MNSDTTFTIEGRPVGPEHPCYIVAEMSANHHQDFDEARRLIDIAAECGVDAVKLQTYTPDTITIDSSRECFRIGEGTIWEGQTLYELYGEAYTPWDWQPRLKKQADELGIHLFSSPFDFTAVDFLEEMDVPAYKIASFELVDIPLIQRVASTGKPVIMSTGMANLSEIWQAVSAVRSQGNDQLALLKCTSAYPAPAAEANLRTIPNLSETFDVVTGLSDHTMGLAVPLAAIALGASVIEKHFTRSRDVEGPDSSFSLEPEELAQLVTEVRRAEAALGDVHYDLTEKQRASTAFRRSLFVVRDVEAGEKFTMESVRSIRPGDGLPPRYLSEVLGRHAREPIERGTPLHWDLID